MKQIPLFQSVILFGLGAFGLLTSCEESGPRTENPGKAPESSTSEAGSTEAKPTPEAAETKGKVKAAVAPGAKPEPAFPELAVYLEGETVVIEGALRSRMQKARIAEEMTREFPDWTVDDRLVQETHRHAVGWGNRVSMGFLIPYFKEVAEPYVGFEEGVVILKGTVSEKGQIRFFQELAINVFAGMYLRDIRNEMIVVAE